MRIRHRVRGRIECRGITPRRLAAARRALRREREKLALFADQVAAEQPTPEERILAADMKALEVWQSHRDLAARQWRSGRKELERHPEYAAQIVQKWNNSWVPAEAHYFADFVYCELRSRQQEKCCDGNVARDLQDSNCGPGRMVRHRS